MKVPDEDMYEHFTDAENTGAPLVPQVDEQFENVHREHEEVVLSHRIEP
jgi:hypothetical protein